MMIGAIGSAALDDVILFEVSPDMVLTFDNFVRRNSVRFAKNDVLLKKPISQYVGPDLDTIDFNIFLDAQLGVDPKTEYDKLIEIQHDGSIVTIVIGTSVFGSYRWRISDLVLPKGRIDNTGFIGRTVVNISFEEYARG